MLVIGNPAIRITNISRFVT